MIKRQRLQPSQEERVMRPFRRVGVVSNSVPCAVTSLGETYTVSTVAGRCVQTYDAASLRLLFVTQPPCANRIDSVAAHFHFIFVASGTETIVYRRGREVARCGAPQGVAGRARKLEVFGEYVCALYTNLVVVYRFNSKESNLGVHCVVQVPSMLGAIVGGAHLPTYLNKLVLATQSSLVLVNVKSGKVVHVYDEVPSGISGIVPAPHVLDIAGVWSPNGDVQIMNLRTGKILFTLHTGTDGICSLSFRSDKIPLLCVGTLSGDVLVYDLEKRRRVQTLRADARSTTASATSGTNGANVVFLQGQPLLCVSSGSNELSEYVFDPPVSANAGHRARLLRRRGGHSAPPSCMLFDPEAHFVLSGALDGTLWMFSLRKDSQSRRLGNQRTDKVQQQLELKGVTALAYSPRKSWPTLVSAHSNSKVAFTWDAVRGKAGTVKLPTPDGSLVKQVAVSQCGNFGLVGSHSGRISAYNLQSGLLRMDAVHAHASAVTGLAVSPNNATVYSTGLDGCVRATEFRTGQELARLDLRKGAITGMRYHPASRLLACATDDMVLLVVDTATMKVVREFAGHGNRITGFDFTPSGRWLLSGSLDHTLRTWDIPSGACINGITLDNPVTELCVSPNAEYVATAHVQGLGVQMWVLNTQKGNLRPMREEEFPNVYLDSPEIKKDEETDSISVEDVADEMTNSYGILPPSLDQIDDKLTLSGEPRIKFTTLVHLDAIRERNKPVEGVSRPAKMPFFLDASGTEGSEPNGLGADDGMQSRLQAPVASFESEFTRILETNPEKICEHLTKLGPAATDLEIRSLSGNELDLFVQAMAREALSGTKFELVQAWMQMCLSSHKEEFTTSNEHRLSLDEWLSAERMQTAKLGSHVQYCLGVLSFLRA